MPNLNVPAGAAGAGLATTAAHRNLGVIPSTATSMRRIELELKDWFGSFQEGLCDV
jgi:hypothetical protein